MSVFAGVSSASAAAVALPQAAPENPQPPKAFKASAFSALGISGSVKASVRQYAIKSSEVISSQQQPPLSPKSEPPTATISTTDRERFRLGRQGISHPERRPEILLHPLCPLPPPAPLPPLVPLPALPRMPPAAAAARPPAAPPAPSSRRCRCTWQPPCRVGAMRCGCDRSRSGAARARRQCPRRFARQSSADTRGVRGTAVTEIQRRK